MPITYLITGLKEVISENSQGGDCNHCCDRHSHDNSATNAKAAKDENMQ